MKLTKHLLAPLVGLAALLMGVRPAAAQYINVQVNFHTIKHWETSACWESGSEEYTALVYANLDGGGWQGGQCFEINNNGDCTQGINYTPINTTTLATTLGTRLNAHEDDGGSRCSYDSGDDCHDDNNWSHTIRSLTRATWNAFNDYGTSNHRFSYQVYWNWLAPPVPMIGSASSVAAMSFTANWSNSDGNYRVTSYKLYVATDSGFVNHVGGYNGLDLGTATSRSVTGLTAGQTYYFRVTAANEAGTSGVSGTGSTTLPKYDQTITFTQPANKTYGDAAFALSATASSGLGVTFSLVSGPATVTGGGTVTLTGAGTVTVRASQTGNGSYNAAPNVDRSFTVNPKGVTITGVSATNKVYDRATTASLSGGAVSGVLGGDTVTITAGSGAFASANVGTHAVTASGYGLGGAQAGNYTLTAQPTVANASITAKTLTVTGAAVTTKVYDGNTGATLTGTLSGIVGGDTVTLSGTGTFDTRDVGANKTVSSTSTLGGAQAGNYSLTQPTGLTGAITAKALTVTADVMSKTYGEADPALTYASDGLFNGDTLTGSLTRAAGENAGTYAIGQGTLAADANYTLVFTGAALTVNKAPLVCKPADVFSVQGLPQPPFTIGYQGFVNGETAAVLNEPPVAVSSATAASPKGAYPITCEGGADDNYEFVGQTGTWHILQRATLIRIH